MQSNAKGATDEGAEPPTLIPEHLAGNTCQSHGNQVVGEPSQALQDAALLARIDRFVQDISAGRIVPDAEIRRHAADCTLLMEQAEARFREHRDPADREHAAMWMHRRDEANNSLGNEQGATGCYFMDQADAARRRLAGGRR